MYVSIHSVIMETAITESFMKSIQAAVDQCMERVKEESQIFANALRAVRHLPPIATPVAVPAASATPITDSMEHRIAALELAYQRQVQKTIAGLSEDIGDLDGRLAAIERTNRPDLDDVAVWDKGPSAWTWPGPSKKNEVVVVDDRTTVCDFGLGDVLVNVNHVEDDVEMLSPVPASVPVVKATPEPKVEPKEEEEESDPLELEEFEHEGTTYYRDPDNNVYKPNEDGEVDAETPVGRWLEKKQTLKLY